VVSTSSESSRNPAHPIDPKPQPTTQAMRPHKPASPPDELLEVGRDARRLQRRRHALLPQRKLRHVPCLAERLPGGQRGQHKDVGGVLGAARRADGQEVGEQRARLEDVRLRWVGACR
jgi:hypothetical protein